jgi:hypothetical protein
MELGSKNEKLLKYSWYFYKIINAYYIYMFARYKYQFEKVV